MSNQKIRTTGKDGFLRGLLLFVILVSSFVIPSIAQEPTPPPEKRGVQLEFVPPPMENATISMGIYDSAGKLVRVLHQEAPPADFFPALNGLITFWDGKDDSGKLMPAGKYRAKGYMAGEMDFEGVAFLCNDFVDKDGVVQIRHIDNIAITKKGNLSVQDGTSGISLDSSGQTVDNDSVVQTPKILVKDGMVFFPMDSGKPPVKFPAVVDHPVSASEGLNGTMWVIDGDDVKQFSSDGQLLRHLAAKAGDPSPVQIQASPMSDEIFLLEQNDKTQRIRGLALVADTASDSTPTPAPQPSPGADSPQKSSIWKVVFNKSIIFSDKLEQAADQLKMTDGKPFVPQAKIGVRLLPNPLEQDKVNALDISIGIDAKGSFLKAGDGLPLCRVSETPNLKWAAMAREAGSKVITIFQSDGAVVEQFKASKLANMMGFDAGDFDFDPAKVK